MNGYMPYTPGMMPAGLSNPMDIQNRIQQLQQMQQQYQSTTQDGQQTNVNWIRVSGIEGARSQLVQFGSTVWMLDNNLPFIYVKSVDKMGTPDIKAYRFEEVPIDALTNTSNTSEYVTRQEFNALLEKLNDSSQKGDEKNE